MGDFTGFEFGGKHSSELGIIRVSGGDRYEENLHPEIEDITTEVPGLDGSYYFGTNYKPKTIEVKIAFDSLNEKSFRDLKRVFEPKRIKDLIFDEWPYKKYMAKVESPIELSFVCFDEPKKIVDTARDGVRRDRTENESSWEQVTPYKFLETKERIYKGEGTISFICYFPFAKSVYKSIPIEEEESDWAISSGILTADEYQEIDKYDSETGEINIYNGGDLETGFRLYVPGAPSEQLSLSYKRNELEENSDSSLVIEPFTLEEGDIGFLIDTNNSLIVGVKPQTIVVDDQEMQVGITYNQEGNAIYKTSGNLYNKYINSGYFFHLEPNEKNDNATLQIEGGMEGIEIFYDYLYF